MSFIVLGLLLASFTNVLVARGPAYWGLVDAPTVERPASLMSPPSSCPHCGTRIAAYDLIPVLSYLLLRGKCRTCGGQIPPSYPYVEAIGGILGLVAIITFSSPLAALLALMTFIALLALGLIDEQTGYLPDALTLPLTALAFIAAGFTIFVTPTEAIWGWVFGWSSLALLAFIYRELRGREGLGGGDAKLLGAGGALIGPYALPPVLIMAALGALFFVMMTKDGSVRGTDEIRFGPWLAGAIAIIFTAKGIWPDLIP